MKKIFIVIALCLMCTFVVTLFTSCNSEKTTSNSEKTTVNTPTVITITADYTFSLENWKGCNTNITTESFVWESGKAKIIIDTMHREVIIQTLSESSKYPDIFRRNIKSMNCSNNLIELYLTGGDKLSFYYEFKPYIIFEDYEHTKMLQDMLGENLYSLYKFTNMKYSFLNQAAY